MATVLLADVDEERVRALRRLVRREGHRTLVGMDGRSALHKALRSRPAAVLAHVGLPALDGFGLALSIREELGPEITRVVLYREHIAEEDHTTARAVGADGIASHHQGDEGLLESLRGALAARTPPERGLSGQADRESLFTILQFLHQRRETGTLSLAGEVRGTLVLDGGEILGARTAQDAGVEALLALLRCRDVRYCFDRDLVDPSARNLEGSFDRLLMDAFAALMAD